MSVAQAALKWAESQVGKKYSQAKRWDIDYFDCSSLVYRAFKNAGVNLKHKDTGEDVSTSTTEVYAKGFALLYPSAYNQIGKQLPSKPGLLASLDLQPGDIIFYNHKDTNRANKITHVTMYAGNGRIVHARSTQTGVRYDKLSYMQTGVCAVIRYGEAQAEQKPKDGKDGFALNRVLKITRPLAKGDDVKAVQQALIAKGFNCGRLGADGVYGSSTAQAVRHFQSMNRLIVDGKVGKFTVAALGGKWIE